MTTRSWLAMAAGSALLAAGTAYADGTTSSCVACHSNPDYFEDTSLVAHFQQGVHAAVGLSCQDCHGGNPDPSLSDDPDAMDPDFASNPYRGAPSRTEIPVFCGRCHSDPLYMKRFKPDARVDQEEEYGTSQHGRLLATGDENVATCIDCHGLHGILKVDDPEAPVYPTQVAETCGHCHSDPQRMAGYELPDGRPLPVDQLARWKRSVHAKALLEKEDLFAPTCNDCHGNHGAAPPGLESITFVCGGCHGREAELFRASPKQEGFERHAEMMEGGTTSCSDCHQPPEPQAEVSGVHTLSECITCHGNHAVVRPTVALLSPLPETPCALCHESPEALPEELREPPDKRALFEKTRDELVAELRKQGLSGDELFDALVDRALVLSHHVGGEQGEEQASPRPEWLRLFEKFRIGKTHFTYQDPATGETVHRSITRCSTCHGPEPELGQPTGWRTAKTFLEEMQQVTVLTARAERLLLTAQRGGVEVRSALLELDKAVDSQIEMEVLVHTFSADPDGAFAEKRQEGEEHATKATKAGRQALAELTWRRQGLGVSLVVVALVLVALALKIRDVSRRDRESEGP